MKMIKPEQLPAQDQFSLGLIRELANAAKEQLEMEPAECLAELIEVAEKYLGRMPRFAGKMKLQIQLKQIREKWCSGQVELI